MTIFIANRGEIALRVAHTARRMGYDVATQRGGYLDIDRTLAEARAAKAWGVHPGYGFLAERAEFADRCAAEGLVFIGPTGAAMRALGDKSAAKRLIERAAGDGAARGPASVPRERERGRLVFDDDVLTRAPLVPLLPGYHGTDQRTAAFAEAAERIGYPIMVKAAAGGGGRGMRRIEKPADLERALAAARAEAESAFGDGTLLLERALEAPRHIEIQIAADTHGNVVHLGERDCSIQRRYQKLIEESPSPAVDEALRERLGAAAIAVVNAAAYTNLGTIEFLLDRSGAFYFMEANARLQVEHPVTEAVTNLDLVEWQIRIARGEPLPLAQREIRIRGHAIEARLCAEDPARGFVPQSGTVVRWDPPAPLPFVPGDIRVDTFLKSGEAVTADYDSLLAKIVATGSTRESARIGLAGALARTVLFGVTTNAPFLIACLEDEAFVSGNATTAFVAELNANLESHAPGERELAAAEAADAERAGTLRYRSSAEPFGTWAGWSAGPRLPVSLEIESLAGGKTYRVVPATSSEVATAAYTDDGEHFYFTSGAVTHAYRDLARVPAASKAIAATGDGTLRAPTTGKILEIRVEAGTWYPRGTIAVTMDSMKMEHAVTLPADATIDRIAVVPGAQAAQRSVLLTYRTSD